MPLRVLSHHIPRALRLGPRTRGHCENRSNDDWSMMTEQMVKGQVMNGQMRNGQKGVSALETRL
jgi:hypothetical protein